MKKITLQEWISVVDTSNDVRVRVGFPIGNKREYAGLGEFRRKASPAEMETPIHSVSIGQGDEGIDILLIKPKEYSTKRPGVL